MKTREKILQAALGLFNDHGVNSITTRRIAAEIGISQGNLHYHYPNKELIMARLYEQFIEKIRDAALRPTTNDFSRQVVLDSMLANYQVMYSYRFLFVDRIAVWRMVPGLKKEILDFIDQKRLEIRSLIQEYKKTGVLREGISENQVDFLAHQFTLTITSWLTAREYIGPSQDVAYFARFTYRIWLPYLSEAEKTEWEKVLDGE